MLSRTMTMQEDVKNAMLFLTVKNLIAVVLQTVEFLFNQPSWKAAPGRDGSSSKSSVHIGSMIDVGKKPKHLLTCLCRGQAQLLPAGKVGSLRAVHTVAHINPLEF
ncbi:hypothetical protein Pint_29682 [Pistacia integerrima]|uniref:Uncharacterized protein n=1 Tax=Pistacia integerrima TaxID=434235 RepID=A0ACC0X1Q9_9ROSI|nr:hypothetical protein Pint_29682 [Pistacia integerrima]